MKHASLSLIAVSLLLVGAGCAKPAPSTNSPSANAPAVNAPTTNVPGTNGAAPATGLKRYESAPYDFSYPAQYAISDRPMNDAARKPYLDAGLDAPLQFTSFATVTRPPGFVGEGPPTVYVIQWNNAQRRPLREWAKKQSNYTNFTAAADAKAVADTFLGRPSLAYEYDGLYGGKARLIDLDGTVLQIAADFDANAGDTNMAAFAKILETLSLAKQ